MIPRRLRALAPAGVCRSDPGDSWVTGLRLGRATLLEPTIISPSPHGDAYELRAGPLGTATLHGWVRLDDSMLRWPVHRIGPGVPVTVTG